MTSGQFIENLDYQYIEIYSLLRLEETREYVEKLYQQLKSTNDERERKGLLDLSIRGNQKLLHETGRPHPTAMRTNVFQCNHPKAKELMDIFSIEYTEQNDWMCAPVFREMIVFYSKENEVKSILNICLSCDNVEDENRNDLRTDFKVFNKLRTYFKSIGHQIEEI